MTPWDSRVIDSSSMTFKRHVFRMAARIHLNNSVGSTSSKTSAVKPKRVSTQAVNFKDESTGGRGWQKIRHPNLLTKKKQRKRGWGPGESSKNGMVSWNMRPHLDLITTIPKQNSCDISLCSSPFLQVFFGVGKVLGNLNSGTSQGISGEHGVRTQKTKNKNTTNNTFRLVSLKDC